jgi:hypothetical protein
MEIKDLLKLVRLLLRRDPKNPLPPDVLAGWKWIKLVDRHWFQRRVWFRRIIEEKAPKEA